MDKKLEKEYKESMKKFTDAQKKYIEAVKNRQDIQKQFCENAKNTLKFEGDLTLKLYAATVTENAARNQELEMLMELCKIVDKICGK